MGKVSNRFFIRTIQDGSTVTASLIANTKLTQYVSNGGACSPNWNEGGDLQPKVYVYSRLNGTPTPPVVGSRHWYWNGAEILFDSSSHKSTNIVDPENYPVFMETTQVIDGKSFPAIQIIRNLGTLSTDNDVLSFKGSMELGGIPQDFAVDIVIRISTLAGEGFNAICGGDTEVTNKSQGQGGYTATVYALLYNGTNKVTSGISAKFYRVGIDTDTPAGGWPKVVNTATVEDETTYFGNVIPAGSYKTTINASEITDMVVIRCDFYKDGEKIASDWMKVDDQTDPEEMFIVNSTGTTVGQSDIQLRGNQSVTIKAWMGYSTKMYERHPDYNTFKCQLSDAQGKIITSGNPIPSGKTVDANGFFDITKNDMVVKDKNDQTLLASGVGGEITITAEDIDTYCNGGLGGVITAEYVTNS